MKRKSQRAFTITELVIVIAVIAILAAVLIPTFSSVVEKAKVGTDTANAKTFSTQLSVHMVDSDVTITESNAREYITSVLAVNLVPQSASYGYHYVYNMNTGMIELKKLDEVVDATTVQPAKLMSTTRSADWGNTPETCFLKQGYVFLDTAGSELAEVVNAMHNVNTADDLNNVIGKLPSIEAKSETVADYLKLYIDSVVFVGEGANFTTSTNPKNVLFADGVRNITSVVNTLRENGEVSTHNASMKQPLATLSEGSVVEVPSTVEKISNNALVFGDNATLHFSGTLSETASKLEFSFTDCNFTFGNDNTLYTLSDDGRKIVSTATQEEVSGELTSKFPVADFKIKADGVENYSNVLTIARNALVENKLKLIAYDFTSEGGSPFVTDSTVTWSVSGGESVASIEQSTGILTVNGVGTIYVTATASSGVSKQYTVIVYGVTDVEVDWTGSAETEIPFEGQQSKNLSFKKTTANATATFTLLPLIQPNDGGATVNAEYSVSVEGPATVDQGDNGFIATFTGNGWVKFTITFTHYPEVERTINVYVYEGVFNYNVLASGKDAQQVYRFGTGGSNVPVQFADNAVLDNVQFGGESPTATVAFSDDKTTMTFGGEGKILVTATVGETVIDSFLVEVIPDAVNVRQSSEFSATQSMCLVADITLSGDISTLTVAEDKALYGNGYTIDARTANYSNCLIELQGTMDNVIVFGFEPNIIGLDGGTGRDYASTIKMTKSGATISNSYIQGGQYVVNVHGIVEGGSVNISNTSVVNGTIGIGATNIVGKFTINLTNITVTQFKRGEFVGAGIGFYEKGGEKVTVNFIGQNNKLLCYYDKAGVEFMFEKFAKAKYTGPFLGFLIDIVKGQLWDALSNDFMFKTEDKTADYLHVGMVALLNTKDIPTMNVAGSNVAGGNVNNVKNWDKNQMGIHALMWGYNNFGVTENTGNTTAEEQLAQWLTLNSSWTVEQDLSAQLHTFGYNL